MSDVYCNLYKDQDAKADLIIKAPIEGQSNHMLFKVREDRLVFPPLAHAVLPDKVDGLRVIEVAESAPMVELFLAFLYGDAGTFPTLDSAEWVTIASLLRLAAKFRQAGVQSILETHIRRVCIGYRIQTPCACQVSQPQSTDHGNFELLRFSLLPKSPKPLSLVRIIALIPWSDEAGSLACVCAQTLCTHDICEWPAGEVEQLGRDTERR